MVSRLTLGNKFKMEDGNHIEFDKMLISLHWMKVFVQSVVERCNATTKKCARDEKLKRKLIHTTSSVEHWEQMWVVLGDYTRYKCKKNELTANDTSKTAKITKRSLPTSQMA